MNIKLFDYVLIHIRNHIKITSYNCLFFFFNFSGQQVHYECFEGFELYGDSVRRCFNGSQWSGPGVTSCKVKHCGSIGDILFGKVEFIRTGKEEGVDTPGAKAQYSCQDDRFFDENRNYRINCKIT